jgi:hypothetical protein
VQAETDKSLIDLHPLEEAAQSIGVGDDHGKYETTLTSSIFATAFPPSGPSLFMSKFRSVIDLFTYGMQNKRIIKRVSNCLHTPGKKKKNMGNFCESTKLPVYDDGAKVHSESHLQGLHNSNCAIFVDIGPTIVRVSSNVEGFQSAIRLKTITTVLVNLYCSLYWYNSSLYWHTTFNILAIAFPFSGPI